MTFGCLIRNFIRSYITKAQQVPRQVLRQYSLQVSIQVSIQVALEISLQVSRQFASEKMWRSEEAHQALKPPSEEKVTKQETKRDTKPPYF